MKVTYASSAVRDQVRVLARIGKDGHSGLPCADASAMGTLRVKGLVKRVDHGVWKATKNGESLCKLATIIFATDVTK